MSLYKIGSICLGSRVLLAPMAGVTDRAYRELCMSMGAGYCVSEMVSSKALSFNSKKSEALMGISDSERPCGIQLFGDDPGCMAEAAKKALENKPEFLDINMGCPAPKISSNGSGSALMKNPSLCGELVSAVKEVSQGTPVTVKIRKGWDENSANAVLVAKLCEKAGADAVTVHGRTRQQFYKPPVDYNIISEVRQAVNIPVIANGDIDSPQKASEVIRLTGCELIMIGRASMGNPWIFSQVNSYLDDSGAELYYPTAQERMSLMVEHVRRMIEYKGERIGVTQARKLVVCYFKGMRSAAALRGEAGRISTLEDVIRLKEKALSL